MLKIDNLTVWFDTDEGSFKAADNISIDIKQKETIGLVGESGSGKSVTALSIPKLIPCPPGRIEKGEIWFGQKNLLKLSTNEIQNIRGKKIGTIFQEPLSSLSPLHKIGDQMVETLQFHHNISKKDAWDFACEWLKKVKITDPIHKMSAYPYQLSGGMQQRIMIAIALMMEPDLIIADEPTTALDVTVQAQIFELIKEMTKQQTSVLLITHDMGVVWELCDRVFVMYASKIVEKGSLNDIFFKPAHPYTKALLQSIPTLFKQNKRLKAVPGQVPSPMKYPKGCNFQDRCQYVFDRCLKEDPNLVTIDKEHESACFLNYISY